jgi:hypothetical protein
VLTKARAAVEQQVKRWDEKLAPPPVDPVVATEIRAHVLRMQVGDRLPFVAKHILDAGPAVIAGPALSGLTPAEHEIVKKQFEMKMNPELAGAKARTVTALAQAEAGFRNASNTIRSRGGLEVGNGGMAAA